MSVIMKKEPRPGAVLSVVVGDGIDTLSRVAINGETMPCRRICLSVKAGDEIPEISIDFLTLRTDGMPIVVKGRLVPEKYWPRVSALLRAMQVEVDDGNGKDKVP
jgi:hypothetical protein